MEPEDKHRNFIMRHRILDVFGFVGIVLRYTLTVNDFQGLMMEPEGSDNGPGNLVLELYKETTFPRLFGVHGLF
ncbi:hypothetical protein EVAR_57184_1 [Eumeta japonica]|uniref:Uncharacterized protein n=1 Tax=Eumeta variegata TaxID=151549 RepID=A0A4C1Z3V2_EUMVA|nr:hypothetical protein EVAR_57184_1 [Eumeta japonica]